MSYDTDAQTYITAVEAADDASLPTYIKNAMNAFVVGAKADGFWTAIKAACFLAGPATLAGALTPLVGAAPTNNNFVGGDHNQITGLKGNGSNKRLNTNRNNNSDPRDNNHNAVWVSGLPGASQTLIGAADPFNETGANSIGAGAISEIFSRNRTSTGLTASTLVAGLAAVARSSSANYTRRNNSTNTTVNQTSQTPASRNVFVFDRTTGTSSDARLAWYSVGESIVLGDLDARLATYMAAIAAGPTSTIQTRRRRDLGGYGL